MPGGTPRPPQGWQSAPPWQGNVGQLQQWGPPQGGPRSPQPWPPPGRPQRPRRRRSLFGSLVRLALVILAIMFISATLRSVTSGPETPNSPGSSDAPASGPYVNEEYTPPPPDMNPPELPMPDTVGQAENYVTSNTVYNQSIPSPTACKMNSLDPNGASKAELETHLNQLMGCLMAVWEPPLKAAGWQLPRPPVTVYSSPVRTACGVMREVNAAYCAGDQRVYYAQPLLSAFPEEVRTTPYAAETIIAHEFGHAVQARSAILISEKALEQRASKNEGLVMSRRTETQADCFGAQFVRSVAQSQNLDAARLAGLQRLTYNIGDDVLSGQPNINEGHGLGRSREAWFTRGLGSDQIAACNTFTAPASSVR